MAIHVVLFIHISKLQKSVTSKAVNGLRDNRKRELVFNWLVSKKYDCICLQETHCTGVDINRWESEWKTQGGGASAWLCGSSESKRSLKKFIFRYQDLVEIYSVSAEKL